MLGVRRATVTEVALELQKLGIITYTRGHITVLDHGALLAVSCECYELMKNEYELVFQGSANHANRRT